MTISNEVNKVSYVGDAIETDFDFTFKAFAVGDIKVYVDDVLQSSGFSTVLETPPTDGGTVTFTTAPAVDAAVTIVRELDATQEADYPTGGKFPSETHETQLDRQVMLIQQINEALGRAITAPVSSALTSLVIEAIEAGKLLQFNGTGDGIVAVDIGTILETNYEGVLSGLAEGDLLHYDAATGTFINAPPEAGGNNDIIVPVDLIEFDRAYKVNYRTINDVQGLRCIDAGTHPSDGAWTGVTIGFGEIDTVLPTIETSFDLEMRIGMSGTEVSKNKNFTAYLYLSDVDGNFGAATTTTVKTSEAVPDDETDIFTITWSDFITDSNITVAGTRVRIGILIEAGTGADHSYFVVVQDIRLKVAS